MKRPIYSPPDPFSMLPLLSLLPSRGSIARLPDLMSSLFARFEHVAALRKSEEDIEREMARRLSAEEAMLRQVLEWLRVNPESEE